MLRSCKTILLILLSLLNHCAGQGSVVLRRRHVELRRHIRLLIELFKLSCIVETLLFDFLSKVLELLKCELIQIIINTVNFLFNDGVFSS